MRNKISKIAVCLLLSAFWFPAAAFCQYTLVTGRVTDPNGIPYANGTVSCTLVTPGGGSGATLNGVSFDGTKAPVPLDGTGSFTIQLPDNSVIVPASTQWQFTVNEAPGVPPPYGFGPVSFSVNITISGSTQNVSATLSAAAPKLTRIGTNITTTVKVLNNIPYADGGFAGADFCGNLFSAIAVLPATGGPINATGFQGAQSCTTDPLADNTKNITILLGNTTISSGVSWGSTSTGVVRIIGNGTIPNAAPTTLNFTGATAGIVPGSDGWELYNLQIKGNNSTSTDGLALGSLTGVSNFAAYNVAFKNWNNGINITLNSIQNLFVNCRFNSNRQYGIRIAGTIGTGNFPTTTHFIMGGTAANLVAGTYIGFARGIRFDNFLHNGNSGAGVSGVILGGAASEEALEVTFNENWFEANGAGVGDWDIKAQRVRDLKIVDSLFASSAPTPIEIFRNDNFIPITGPAAEHVIIENNSFLGSKPVILDANTRGVQIRNNESMTLIDHSGLDTQLTDRNIFKASRASAIPLAIQGFASQTGNLLEWRNSAGNVLSFIDSAGQPTVGNGTALNTRIFINGVGGASYNGIQLQTAGVPEWLIGRNGTGSEESLIFRNAASVDQMKLTQAGVLSLGAFQITGGTTPATGFIALGTTTVGALPAAGAGNAGQMIKVSDSTAITTEGQTCVGAGAATALAFSNGSVWKCL